MCVTELPGGARAVRDSKDPGRALPRLHRLRAVFQDSIVVGKLWPALVQAPPAPTRPDTSATEKPCSAPVRDARGPQLAQRASQGHPRKQ